MHISVINTLHVMSMTGFSPALVKRVCLGVLPGSVCVCFAVGHWRWAVQRQCSVCGVGRPEDCRTEWDQAFRHGGMRVPQHCGGHGAVER